VADMLRPVTALGGQAPAELAVRPLTVTERFDVALASVAARRGRMADLAKRAAKIGLPLPEAARHAAGTPYSAFWVAPEMWFVEAPFATHEGIAAILKDALGDAASITEQTDAWVALDLAAPDLATLLERLSNVDHRAAADGFATRTVIEHLGCYMVRHGAGQVRLYGPRSSAKSLLHAIEAAATAAF
jgi:sarcosine oxidase, subunit gamma